MSHDVAPASCVPADRVVGDAPIFPRKISGVDLESKGGPPSSGDVAFDLKTRACFLVVGLEQVGLCVEFRDVKVEETGGTE